MANKMLIDAAHPEETRVVVLRGSRVEEFDFEAASKKQLRGNIYLAKVTRVEPSLQAAFIDYGGNRHGFLAFSEIHPDYYQIPVSDRQALIEAEAQDEPEEEERKPQRRSRRHRRERPAAADMARTPDETVSEPAPDGDPGTRPVEIAAADKPPYDDPTPDMIEHASVVHQRLDPAGEDEPQGPDTAPAVDDITSAVDDVAPAAVAQTAEAESDAAIDTGSTQAPEDHGHARRDDALESQAADDHGPHDQDHGRHDHEAHDRSSDDHGAEQSGADEHDESGEDHDDESEEDVSEHVEQLGGDAMEELPVRAHRNRRQYKIQEVIKRRQVLLVQVVKEERGNKGAALTTYLSLAGRYSVLMPNTAKGGGISRKITDAGDRQRLKSIAQDLEVPEGMGVILRTAGASRTKPEVKRDFEYLMRMWETVRETTLGSQAPTLVYEEGSLIKRAIRDLYNKDVDDVIVAGEAGYREAKDFMRMLMPSHARNVQPWLDPQPIFAKAGAEAQLDAMFSSHVTLKSGGYIVINQTEALVAIDVNSGRSTREHNIEDTALRTNLEAADEVARQLRLRDLAGLIVVDFIDMEENRNNRAVEKRIKDALKNDRARIQVGRISHFGLLEMSRQRIRIGVLEGSTVVCEHCAGAGMVRSTSSIALHVLRILEDALIADASHNITVRTRAVIALYMLNQKRAHLGDLEARFGVVVTFASDEALTGTTYCAVDRGEPATGVPQPVRPFPKYEADPAPEDEEDEVAETPAEDEASEPPEADGEAQQSREEGGSDADGQRRKRRRRRRGRDRESSGIAEDAPQPADDALGFVADVDAARLEAARLEQDGAEPHAVESEGSESSGPAEDSGLPRRRRSRRGGRRTREEGRPSEPESLEVSPYEEDADPRPMAVIAGSDPGVVESVTAAAPVVEAAPEAEASGVIEAHEPIHEAPAPSEEAHAGTPPPLEETHAGTPAPSEETHAEVQAPAKEADHAVAPAAAPDPVVETAAATREAASPKKPDLVSSELDPAAPKRSGWWQRAKATLGG